MAAGIIRRAEDYTTVYNKCWACGRRYSRVVALVSAKAVYPWYCQPCAVSWVGEGSPEAA